MKMFKTHSFLFLLIFTPMTLSNLISPGIETPHVVAIMLNKTLVCYGINWSGQSVLTAGHCVDPKGTYEILAGFYGEDASLTKYLFHTKTKHIYRFPKFDHKAYDHNMALLVVEDIIPVTHVTSPASPYKCFTTKNHNCFLIIWDLKNNIMHGGNLLYSTNHSTMIVMSLNKIITRGHNPFLAGHSPLQKGFPVAVNIKPGICLRNEAFTGVSIVGRKFCGESDFCLPDISGASLTCRKEVIGMVIQTSCDYPVRHSKLVFINLNSALDEITRTEIALLKNLSGSVSSGDSRFEERSFSATNYTVRHIPSNTRLNVKTKSDAIGYKNIDFGGNKFLFCIYIFVDKYFLNLYM